MEQFLLKCSVHYSISMFNHKNGALIFCSKKQIFLNRFHNYCFFITEYRDCTNLSQIFGVICDKEASFTSTLDFTKQYFLPILVSGWVGG